MNINTILFHGRTPSWINLQWFSCMIKSHFCLEVVHHPDLHPPPPPPDDFLRWPGCGDDDCESRCASRHKHGLKVSWKETWLIVFKDPFHPKFTHLSDIAGLTNGLSALTEELISEFHLFCLLEWVNSFFFLNYLLMDKTFSWHDARFSMERFVWVRDF